MLTNLRNRNRIMLAVLCSLLALGMTVWAELACADEPVWPIEGDCTACHAKEAFEVDAEPGDGATDEAEPSQAEAESDVEAADPSAPVAATDGEEADSDETAHGGSFVAIHSAFGCAACHADEKLAELHDGVTPDDKMPKKLKKTSVDAELCLTCHESYESLAQKTADCEALVDDRGTVVNPHALPDVDDHAPITCVDCHTVHKDVDKPVAEKAREKCLSCHHENVFECGTCH